MRKTLTTMLAILVFTLPLFAQVSVKTKPHTPQTAYAATIASKVSGKYDIRITISGKGEPEGFTLKHKGRKIEIIGNDGSGAIYGANRLLECFRADAALTSLTTLTDAPEMKLRGTCVGLQKTVYLPGHRVYEYPYTPENFPWFYDKDLWTRYLDLLAENNMNTLYLWNGHPFASLVKLDDYPFAPEVDEETMHRNQEMFGFLTTEADRRGIRVIQMFYNIIVSKPFADHYGIKTQDRNRPITPLIADYTRKSIAAFVERYPKVGFLVCLGEAMSGIDTDIQWMTETIIPGIKDGLAASGRTDQPPIILRSHDTDGPAVLAKALPLYPNIYTMTKYTGESLTTYEPGGPWGETHRALAAASPIHIDNVHILANLEPWRWSSPAFTQQAVQAMHTIHHAKGLHLYPQASYWDWPYTADRTADGHRLLQIDRDWMWYKCWGRYAWNCHRGDDESYWTRLLSARYGIDESLAAHVLNAYDEAGEIAPKLIRRFGITEGNRQTLLLGMKMSQLVNPYKYTIYPGFYESCGPQGEKLIEFVEKKWKNEPHEGELPHDIITQCLIHGSEATTSIGFAHPFVKKNKEEFARIANDMRCYHTFACAFYSKVLAAEKVLDYKWTKDICHLDTAIVYLEESLGKWKELVELTNDTYLYANSMQTAQRRIPVGGDDGHFKTWAEMLPVYEEEVKNLKANIEKLRNPRQTTPAQIHPIQMVAVRLLYAGKPTQQDKPSSEARQASLQQGALLFEGRNERIDTIAPELQGLQALVLNRDTTRIEGTMVEFSCDEPVEMLVGFFIDDDPKWAKPPRLETDATGNEYGQAEPVLRNAINMTGMPTINIHAYHFSAGHHVINLPQGIIMVAGFAKARPTPRDAGLQGAGDEVDWLFQ
ncbi:MAG: hypothetical protein J5637_01305 [Prevotella sp.]|nr:hypothetical protein [Prevotella sp.]